MSIASLVFGDVFMHEDNEYIFLASTSDQIYTAKILNLELSNEISNSYKVAVRKNKQVALRNLLYCFVILSTEELKNRMASLARTDGHRFEKAIKKQNVSLNMKDLKSLKEEIVSSRGTPLILKELVSNLELTD